MGPDGVWGGPSALNVYAITAAWMALALLASLVSVRIGISVALVEIVVGALAGNLPVVHDAVQQTAFTTFLAGAGSMLLTFLAGAEIDPVSLRRHLRASVVIGVLSFALPFLATALVCRFVLGWTPGAAEIAGTALSTTSVAVVYAVMVETGLNRQDLGKLILAACFVTDLGTVLALGALFAGYGLLLALFIGVSAVVIPLLPWAMRLVIRSFGHRVSEPEIKFLLLVLFGLGGLASAAGSEAVLPAYVAGLVVAGVFLADRVLIERMRSIAFALLTPFFFLRAGLNISASALVSGAGLVALLFGVKMVAKLVGVWPAAALFGISGRERNYTTLLMATGLTFGSISALFGLNHNLIDRAQYSVLLTVVILSAILPTLVALRLFQPETVDQEAEEALGAEDVAIIHRGPRTPWAGGA